MTLIKNKFDEIDKTRVGWRFIKMIFINNNNFKLIFDFYLSFSLWIVIIAKSVSCTVS